MLLEEDSHSIRGSVHTGGAAGSRGPSEWVLSVDRLASGLTFSGR